MTLLTTSPRSSATESAAAPRKQNPALRGPVLLATHGMELSDAPIIAARRLANRLGRHLRVVTVVEPPPEVEPSFELGPLLTEVAREHVEAQEDTVRRAVEAVPSDDPSFTLEVRYGRVSNEIAAAARECDATVLVLGANPRHRLVRALAGVRASQVLRLAGVPVLAVPQDVEALPRRAVAAVDFAPPSIRAAFAALLLLEEGGELTLVHVRTGDPDAPDDVDTEQSDRLVDRLRAVAPQGVVIRCVTSVGSVADTVMTVADQARADLIAVGTHGPRLAERLFIGSVATRVLHLAQVAVIATAAPLGSDPVDWALDVSDTMWTDAPDEWGPALDAFSRRNAGRPIALDEYDLDIGAQVEARGCTLLGTVYDPHDACAELMLSLGADSRAHLTRSIPVVRSVAIRSGGHEADAALAIRHDGGQTVLRFTD
jgi:nucleotide-binding universal stress UspA family protein